jgi:hypothetical protein
MAIIASKNHIGDSWRLLESFIIDLSNDES